MVPPQADEASANAVLKPFARPVGDVEARSASGAASVLISQAVTLAATLASVAILARLLRPEDFGVMGMTTAISGLALLFADLGLSHATIQRRTITEGQVSNLFWINVSLGAALTVALFMSAPLIAAFYRTPEVLHIARATSPAFILAAIPMQHIALLRRAMRFGALATIQTGSSIGSHLVGILLAYSGCGVWSLVGANLTLPILTAVGAAAALPWVPSLPARGHALRGMVSFGLDVAGFGLVNYLSRNADNILIGRFLGPSSLGYYSRAYDLVMWPLARIRAPLLGVAGPALSSLQDSPEQYRRYVHQLVLLVAAVSFPVGCLLMLLSSVVVQVLLGKAWQPVSSVLQLLAWAVVLQPVTQILGALLVSLGFTRRYLLWGICHSSVMVVAFIGGLPWGVRGVAAAYAAANALVLVPSVVFCTRRTPVRWLDYLRALTLPGCSSASAFAATIVVTRCIGVPETVAGGALIGVLFISVYLGPFVAHPRYRRSFMEGLSRVRRRKVQTQIA